MTKSKVKLTQSDLEYDTEAKQFKITKLGYAKLLYHGHYDPKYPMAYLDYVRRTGKFSETSKQ